MIPQTVEREELSIADPYDGVRIVLDAGAVAVAEADVDAVHIERILRYRGDRPEPTAAVIDGVLELGVDCRHCSVDHLVLLPYGADTTIFTGAGDVDLRHMGAPVWVETAAGDIEVEDHSAPADLHSQAGHVRIFGALGPVIASSQAGDVLAENLRSDEVILSSQAGDVEAELLAAPDYAELTSQAGNVRVRLPAGTYAIDARARAGNITVDGLDDRDGATRELVLVSEAGNVSAIGF